MKKPNELFVVVCLILFACATNFFVYQASRLEDPVFLVHAYAVEQTQQTKLRFYYIQNHEDMVDIIDISFPEWQAGTKMDTSFHQESYGTYGRYRVSAIVVDFAFSAPIDTPITLKQMQVQWANGKTSMENLGNLVFFPSQTKDWFLSQSGESDNQGTADYTGMIQEDVELVGLDIPLENYFAGTLQIQQNDHALQFPQKLSANTQWQIKTQFLLPKRDNRRHMVIQIQPALVVQRADGTMGTLVLYDSMTYEPHFSQWEIFHILHMRGVM